MAVLTRGLAALREVEQTEIWPWCQLIWDWSFLSVLFPMLSIDLVLDTRSLIPLSISFSIKLSANEFDYVLASSRDAIVEPALWMCPPAKTRVCSSVCSSARRECHNYVHRVPERRTLWGEIDFSLSSMQLGRRWMLSSLPRIIAEKFAPWVVVTALNIVSPFPFRGKISRIF